MTNDNELDIGQRVSRKVLFADHETKRFGVIYEVYTSKPDHNGHTKNMYSVKWDDTGFVERGYLSNGLMIEQ